MKTFWKKLRQLTGRRSRVNRLEEEIAQHIALLEEENLKRGLDAVEARRQAHLAFGNVLATREASEDAMGWPQVESWVHDFKITTRGLLRRPSFALSLIVILGLGIGVTTAIFSLLRGVLWQELPVDRPAELHLAVDRQGEPFLLSAPTIQRLEAEPAMRGRVIAYSSPTGLTLRRGDAPAEPLQAQFVHGAFFDALKLGAVRGRLLTSADDPAGAPQAVVVISWQWWQQKLGGDPAALGQTLRVNGHDVTVVGIVPAAFTGISLGSGPDVWLPLGLHASLRSTPSAMIISEDEPPKLADWVRDDHVAWLNLMLRLSPAVAGSAQGGLEAAWQPQLTTVSAVLTDPAARGEYTRNVPRLIASPQGFSSTRDDFRKVGLTLSLLVAAVVLVTVANTSTLLLLRMLSRGREMGVRLALGAGRWRLARAALMEGLVLSLAGAAVGFLLGLWLTPLLGEWLVPSATAALPGTDAMLLLALAGLAVVLGLALGALPAWLAAHISPQVILRSGSAGQRRSLVAGRLLIVVQLALSVLLVSVAVSLALDLRRVVHAELGYARESVLTTFFDPQAAGFPPEQQAALMARLKAAAETVPQVRVVGFAGSGVLSRSRSASGVYFRGPGVKQPTGNVQHERVDESYFEAMGMTLLRGRAIAKTDTATAPKVAIVSQRLAREVFGDADPIGRRFGFDENSSEDDWEIVGIAADARVNSVRSAPPAMLYTALSQWRETPGCLVIRVDGSALGVREQLQKKVAAAEPALMFSRWLTIEERVQRWVRNDVATVRLTAGFGLLAVLLAAIGVLGALGYLVASRSREIAVRLAIGAEPGRVWFGIVREALGLGVAGSLLGLLLAIALPRWLGSWMMTGLKTDAWAIALAVVVGLLAALVGGLLPARRAAKVDPLTLLRSE